MQENAAQGIRQNTIFRGCMPPPPPSQTSRLRFCNKCIGQILGLDPALLHVHIYSSIHYQAIRQSGCTVNLIPERMCTLKRGMLYHFTIVFGITRPGCKIRDLPHERRTRETQPDAVH